MADEGRTTLHWADYLVFGLFLGITTIIGIVIGFVNRRKATSKEFLQAGGSMHYFPVAMSLQTSFLSAIFIVSLPAESYNFGIGYGYLLLSYFISFPLIGKLILPIFFKLKITSAYEYLEIRFNKVVRTAASITFLLQMLLYISVVIYTPALTMQQVTPLPTYACILLVSGVCIVYTVIGGMRATIWNDMIQLIVIIGCMAMLIGFGHAKTGSLKDVYFIIKNNSRLEFDVFRPDPTTRTTFWTQVVGGTFLNFAMYGASQVTIQKALSTKSLEEANKSLRVLTVTSAITLSMVMWIGLVMYAYYSECDPQLAGTVDKPDQLVPKFMMDVMGHLHGLPGLFIASTFSGALSSVSGGLNAMAGVMLVDIVGPLYKYKTSENMPERLSAILSRVLALLIGLVVTGMAFATPQIGDLILQIALSIFGMVGGPLFGILCAGLFMPCVNSTGALVGLLVSLGLTLWLGIGTMVDGPALQFLPHSIEGCNVLNDTLLTMPTTFSSATSGVTEWVTTYSPEGGQEDNVLGFYKLSYMYYGLFAIGTALIVSVIVSAMTGLKSDVAYEHIFSCADTCCKCCPPHVRECCRCGALAPDDDADAIEVIKVHFKSKSGSDVAGMDHPIRQLSFTISPGDEDDVFFEPDAQILEKRKPSLHRALYHKDSPDQGGDPDRVGEAQPHNPKLARQDSGIIIMDSDKDSNGSNGTLNRGNEPEMREVEDVEVRRSSSSSSSSSESDRSSSHGGHVNEAFERTTGF